ncbi:MAG TPA: hypothetical protein VGD08_04160 [Stellaceae bacterium]
MPRTGQEMTGSGNAAAEAARLDVLLNPLFGDEYELVEARRVRRFGGELVVLDAPYRSDYLRYLCSVGRDGATVSQQSAMSLLHPAKLVFHYERLMASSFALVPSTPAAPLPRSALLLGLGGGAMLRYVASHLPSCRVTVVEREAAIVHLARRHFHVRSPVVVADARKFVADAVAAPGERYDVILVDLYDAGGAVTADADFWTGCLALLAPGGCLAANWADFADSDRYRPAAELLGAQISGTFYATPRGFNDNLVQFCPTDPGATLAVLPDRLAAFEDRLRLRRRAWRMLERDVLSTTFPEPPSNRAADRRRRRQRLSDHGG